MAKTFEDLVASSSRLVKKEWSSPTELSQELYSLLANSGAKSSYGTASKLVSPTYPEINTVPQSSYPSSVSSFSDTSRVNFQGLKNPITPNYPEVPPLPVKQKLGMTDTVVPVVGGGASNNAIDIKIDAAVAYGSVILSDGIDHAVPGSVDVKVVYSPESSTVLKNLKVLNGSEYFKVPIGTETIVFFSSYALFPVWL